MLSLRIWLATLWVTFSLGIPLYIMFLSHKVMSFIVTLPSCVSCSIKTEILDICCWNPLRTSQSVACSWLTCSCLAVSFHAVESVVPVVNFVPFPAIFCQMRTFCSVGCCVVPPFHSLHFTPVSFAEEGMVSFHIFPGGEMSCCYSYVIFIYDALRMVSICLGFIIEDAR